MNNKLLASGDSSQILIGGIMGLFLKSEGPLYEDGPASVYGTGGPGIASCVGRGLKHEEHDAIQKRP
jgi:hypothetical protein